jgi:hypothetical protein
VAAANRDQAGLWNLLSEKKRNQKQEEDRTGEEDLSAFISNQFELGEYLSSPEYAVVRVLDVNRRTGAVEIYVGNLGYVGSCTSSAADPSDLWSGITWVRFENGSWGYEPGFSSTEQRRSRWENAGDQYKLLGLGCRPL